MSNQNSLQKLEAKLETLTALLKKHGVKHWSTWLGGDLNLIKSGDARGIEHLLSAYGGMGSLNDVYLCPENGHIIMKDEMNSVNDNFLELKSDVYALASDIHRELQRKRGLTTGSSG
ncbi:MAG TPA: hypothetical protein VL197_02435 [Nitrospirota bacterium]|nr:hypothetical protein [Nitrospirota bacterium]